MCGGKVGKLCGGKVGNEWGGNVGKECGGRVGNDIMPNSGCGVADSGSAPPAWKLQKRKNVQNGSTSFCQPGRPLFRLWLLLLLLWRWLRLKLFALLLVLCWHGLSLPLLLLKRRLIAKLLRWLLLLLRSKLLSLRELSSLELLLLLLQLRLCWR